MSSIFPVHPAYRLGCWLLLVVVAQRLSGVWLCAALLSMLLASAAGSRRRWGRLAWRARWLFVSLFVVLAWGMAGEPVLIDGGAGVPTYEGVVAGLTQLGRLLLVLAAVAALIETTPMASLMAGCYAVMQPLGRCGLDVDRAVVRLALTLHYAGEASSRDWRSLLMAGQGEVVPVQPMTPVPDSVSIACSTAKMSDRLVLVAAMLFAIVFFLA